MSNQENQNNNPEQEVDKIGTISYIYDMVLGLKLMAVKINEPLLSLLLEMAENQSIALLKNYTNKPSQDEGTSETKPPE